MNRSGILSRRAFAGGIAASAVPVIAAKAQYVAPKSMDVDGHFIGIIDIYDENDQVSIDESWRLGVRAIMHETGMGIFKTDRAYTKRKKEALEKGFLWGAFHLMSAESVDDQLARYLSFEDGNDERTAMAIDWEPTSHGMMSYDQLRTFIGKFFKAKAFYPMLYCDTRVNDHQEIIKGDPLLAKCPLWFARYRHDEAGLGIPNKTWPHYTMWQFDDEKRKYNAPYPKEVLPGADWNSFKGTEKDLRAAWPFRQV